MSQPAAHLGVITKPLLADAVHDRLLESVIRGELTPGARLNVDSLAESFGVSRTPVREALARLAHAQLVEISRNSSTVVAQWGPADMRARARLIGDIARGVVLDESNDLSGLVVPTTGEPIERFTVTAERIAGRAAATLLVEMVRELAAPVAIYLDADRSGGRGAPCRDRADAALAFLAETLTEPAHPDGRDRIADAVDDVTAVFVDGFAEGRSEDR